MEVAGGEVILVFVMVRALSVTSAVGVPSINQAISVRGKLNSVMVTVKLSGLPVTTLMLLSADRTGPTVDNR